MAKLQITFNFFIKQIFFFSNKLFLVLGSLESITEGTDRLIVFRTGKEDEWEWNTPILSRGGVSSRSWFIVGKWIKTAKRVRARKVQNPNPERIVWAMAHGLTCRNYTLFGIFILHFPCVLCTVSYSPMTVTFVLARRRHHLHSNLLYKVFGQKTKCYFRFF